MQPREAAVVVMAAGAVMEEVVTAAEGIFVVAAILAVMGAGISAVAVTLAADRLRGRAFAEIVLSPSITPGPTPYGR